MKFEKPFPILYTTNVEKSLGFYAGIFGFEIGYRWPDEGIPEYVFLKLGDYGLGLATLGAVKELQTRHLAHPETPSFELCIYVDDIESARHKLLARGVKELVPPSSQPWGERLMYVLDPDAHPIQITSTLPKYEPVSKEDQHAVLVSLRDFGTDGATTTQIKKMLRDVQKASLAVSEIQSALMSLLRQNKVRNLLDHWYAK